MARIKIKHLSPSRDTKSKLLEILGQHNVYASRIIPLKDGYVIITSLEEELDIVFNASCHEALRADGFSPIMPPDLKAKRTVLLFGVDEEAYSHSLEEIQEEIYRINEFTEGCIDAVYKFPSSRNIKITFSSTVPALKAQEAGIKMFYTRVSPHQIQQEEYFDLQNCLKCYMIQDHATSQCPKEKEYKVCSECSEEGHTWQNCPPGSAKRCINCKGDHRTLAYKCPLRKTAIAKAKEDTKNKKTYSQAASTPSPLHFPTLPTLSVQTMEKMHVAMMFALYKDASEPGSFEATLNRVLKRNNLSEVIIGEEIDSRKILNLPSPTTQSTTPTIPPQEASTPSDPSTLPTPNSPPNSTSQTCPLPTSDKEAHKNEENDSPLVIASPTPSTSSSPSQSPPTNHSAPKANNPKESHLANPNLNKTSNLVPKITPVLPKETRSTRHQINKPKSSGK